MVNIVNQISDGPALWLQVDGDPTTGGGVSAPVGSIASGGPSGMWTKVNSDPVTGWNTILDSESVIPGTYNYYTEGPINTTDATVTSLTTFYQGSDFPDPSVNYLEFRIQGRRTGGASGTAGDAASFKRAVRINSNSATGIFSIGTVTNMYTDKDQAGWNVTFTGGGTSPISVNVVGAAGNDITWFAEIETSTL